MRGGTCGPPWMNGKDELGESAEMRPSRIAKGAERPLLLFGGCEVGFSERRIVRRRAGLIGWRRLPIVADLVKQLRTVVIPDQLAQVIEQLDDGESLFRRPISRNGEGPCQELASR